MARRRQPVRDVPAQRHGQAQELRDLQSGAPLARPQPNPVDRATGAQPAAAPGGGPGPAPRPDLFRATDRPNEPATAGLQTQRTLPDDPDLLLRVMYTIIPDPALLRLMRG